MSLTRTASAATTTKTHTFSHGTDAGKRHFTGRQRGRGTPIRHIWRRRHLANLRVTRSVFVDGRGYASETKTPGLLLALPRQGCSPTPQGSPLTQRPPVWKYNSNNAVNSRNNGVRYNKKTVVPLKFLLLISGGTTSVHPPPRSTTAADPFVRVSAVVVGFYRNRTIFPTRYFIDILTSIRTRFNFRNYSSAFYEFYAHKCIIFCSTQLLFTVA